MTENSKQVDGHAYFIRKPIDYLEIMQTTLSYHHDFTISPKPFRIAKTIELPDKEYKEFLSNDILKDQEFLKADTLECYVNQYAIWQVIRISNKDNPDEAVLVQTEGAGYARYVGLEKYYPEQLKEKINEMTCYTKSFIPKGNNWYEGRVDGYKIYAKVYPKPSEYGIDNGRISKLTIKDSENNTLANYDRGWDMKPSDEHMELFNRVKENLENIKPRQKNRDQER